VLNPEVTTSNHESPYVWLTVRESPSNELWCLKWLDYNSKDTLQYRKNSKHATMLNYLHKSNKVHSQQLP